MSVTPLMFPPATPGCVDCNEDKYPNGMIDAQFYGSHAFTGTSLLTLRGKVPTDTPLDCPTQLALETYPAALV